VHLFSCGHKNPQTQTTESSKPITIIIKILRKLFKTIGKKKSVGLNGIHWLSVLECDNE
jgi:hypothetical protein